MRLIQHSENWSQAKEMYEIGLLFLDNQGNAIEGCIAKERVCMFKGKLKEDAIYTIDQFMLTSQKFRHRVADHLYRIKLAKYTNIFEVSPPPENLLFYTYHIKPFDELETRMGDTTYVM